MQDIKHAVRKVATENGFSPLKDWFQALPSSDERHLDSWLTDVCGAADTAANRLIGRKWLISGAARALEPGCYVEGTMVLYGQSGVGKSRLIESLAPRPEWYCSSDIDMSNSQKASQTCQGKFMIELAELASVRRCDMEQLKAYLTTSNDTYVPKFANNPVTVPRCHIYAASTNDPGVLAEEAMSRRFWCVEVGRVDHARFMLIRGKLWAEARDAYLAGESWTLTQEELALVHQSNTRFHDQDPLAEHLAEYLRNMNSGLSYGEEIPTRDLNIEAKRLDLKVHPRRVAKVMRELGWKDRKSNGNTVWCRPLDERKPPPHGSEDEPVPFQPAPNSAASRPN
jgi:predicted P-loop ATPase